MDNIHSGQHFAKLLREKMGNRSLRNVAMRAKLNPTTISNYLIGRLPDLNNVDLINRLAEALEVSPDEIFKAIRLDLEERAQQSAMKALPTEAVKAVEFALRGSDDIPEEGKRQIIDFVKEIQQRYAQKPEESTSASNVPTLTVFSTGLWGGIW